MMKTGSFSDFFQNENEMALEIWLFSANGWWGGSTEKKTGLGVF